MHNSNGGCVAHAAADSATAAYDTVVEPVVEGVQDHVVAPLADAAHDAGEFVDRNAATIAKVASVVGTAAAVGAVCAGTAGVGCGAAVIAGGAFVGGVFGAADCSAGASLAGCAGKGALIGAVGAAAFVATGGLAAGTFGAGALAGGAAGFASAATSQALARDFDLRGLAIGTGIGALTGGLAARIGGPLQRPGAAAEGDAGAGVHLQLRYKPGWSSEQVAAADTKVGALNAAAQRGELSVTAVERSGTSAASMWRRAGNEVPALSDRPHEGAAAWWC